MNAKENLLIIGAGGHGRVVAECAKEMGAWKSIGFLDIYLAERKESGGFPVLDLPEHFGKYIDENTSFFVGIGDNQARRKWYEALERDGASLATILHPKSIISESASLGDGTLVVAGAIINAQTRIGKGVIVNTSATVDHDCVIESYSHIGPGCTLTGNVTVEELAFLGASVTAVPKSHIGSGAIVGAGSLVLGTVSADTTAYGVPAREK